MTVNPRASGSRLRPEVEFGQGPCSTRSARQPVSTRGQETRKAPARTGPPLPATRASLAADRGANPTPSPPGGQGPGPGHTHPAAPDPDPEAPVTPTGATAGVKVAEDTAGGALALAAAATIVTAGRTVEVNPEAGHMIVAEGPDRTRTTATPAAAGAEAAGGGEVRATGAQTAGPGRIALTVLATAATRDDVVTAEAVGTAEKCLGDEGSFRFSLLMGSM